MAALSLTPTGAAPAVTHVNINEHFARTIQGEGPHAGRLSSFLRLAGCHVKCVWCDIPQSWDWERFDKAAESHATSIEDTADLIWLLARGGIEDGRPNTCRVIITGGEPLLQATALGAVFEHLDATARNVTLELETSGTRPLGRSAPWWDHISCSPKIIPSAEAPLGHALDDEVLHDARTIFKFVVQHEADLEAVDRFVAERSIAPGLVWLMPEGIDTDTLTARSPWVIQSAVDRGYNFSSRLHVYGWGNERGH